MKSPSIVSFLPEAWRNRGLAELSGESSSDIDRADRLVRMIAAASSSYANSLPLPVTLSERLLKTGLPMPVYIALSYNSPMTGDKALEQAELIPNAEIRVWENTTRSLPTEVTAELEAFWTRNE
ncbi:MAG: hypothetical protein LBS84_11620 [Clostridiales bacterium]|nr:hypothetical protein [Clostridiales bacterium]